jgi:hypothetical protein
MILKRNQAFFDSLEATIQVMRSFPFLQRVRTIPKVFTRERKMGFVKLLAFILNLSRKSLQIELDEFFELLQNDGVPHLQTGV